MSILVVASSGIDLESDTRYENIRLIIEYLVTSFS